VREQVEDGVTGFLVEPGDAALIAERLRSLAHDPALRRRLGIAGRQRFDRRFRIDRMADSIGAIYLRALTAGGAEGRRPEVAPAVAVAARNLTHIT
jgi:glycosyltransferase involved in cell wall biosynthesis